MAIIVAKLTMIIIIMMTQIIIIMIMLTQIIIIMSTIPSCLKTDIDDAGKVSFSSSCLETDNDEDEIVSLTMCLFNLLVKLLRDPIEVW